MLKKLTDTTATIGLGHAYQSKLFRVSQGTYAGRLVALFQTSPTEIKLTWSDNPATSWSSLQTVASDAADYSFDARMNAAGDIYMVYSEQTTIYAVTRKLTFSGGTWSVGSKVTIYNGHQCYNPSLAIETGGKLWVTYGRYASPYRYIMVKSSSDDGATWGSGPADIGDELDGPEQFIWSRLIIDSNSIHVISAAQDTHLAIRSQLLTGGGWSSSYNIATGNGFTSSFDVALGADGRMGVVFDDDQMYYREFDGSNWGALITLDSVSGVSPQLLFNYNIPIVVFGQNFAFSQTIMNYTDRKSGSFSAPKILDNRSKTFDSLLLYDASSDTYEDLTAQAESWNTADVYHSGSSAFLKDSGDMVFLGMVNTFHLARVILSTLGSGGTVIYSYWDGANWQAFTPANGNSDLSATEVDLLFWIDYAAIPTDWQKRIVNSQSLYWLKIEVSSTFATAPVGTQISAVPDNSAIIFRRP